MTAYTASFHGNHNFSPMSKSFGAFARTLVTRIVRHIAIHNTKQALYALDDRTLTDIGIERADIPNLARRLGTNA